MTNGNGVSRGDRNRNARLARLRELVPLDHAIVAIDLADQEADGRGYRSRLQGAGPQDVPLPGLGPGGRVGLGRAARRRQGLGGVTVS